MDKNSKLLVIVESPSKAKHISKFLKDAGYNNATVLASVGHISKLKDDRSSYKNSGVFVDDNFRLNIVTDSLKKEVINNLKSQVQRADFTYIMTDGDREGEAIAWSLIKFLNIPKNKYARAITHEITPKSVLAALQTTGKLDEKLVSAAHARMAIDKMLGYALSPIAQQYLGAKSVGRCQSAGLKLIVDREKEIENFIPEKYYDLFLDFTKETIKYRAKYIGTMTKKVEHIADFDQLKLIKNYCSENYVVDKILNKIKIENSPLPYTTASLQQDLSSKLHLKVKDLMSICQSLYEQGFITYHRTDSASMSPEFVASVESFIANNYSSNLFVGQKSISQNKLVQDGHEAIRCTDVNLTPNLAEDKIKNALHKKVYDRIWLRSVQSLLVPARYDSQTVTINNNDQLFEFEQKSILEPGFKILLLDESSGEGTDKTKASKFAKNEVLKDCALVEEQKQTQPQSRYTEASLVAQLQKTGIGRPSTFATIVETLLSKTRNYAELKNGKIYPTLKGVQLSNFLDRLFSNLVNLNYTKDLEQKLDDIASGICSDKAMLTDFYLNLESTIDQAYDSAELKSVSQVEKKCPVCGAEMKARRNRFGKLFYGCTNYPDCTGVLNF